MLKNKPEIFNKLGLSGKETEVYLSCLGTKKGLFVSDITKITNIKRSTIDITIDSLLSRGFMSYYLDGRRKRYTAEDPKSLIYSFERSLDDLKKSFPLLNLTSMDNSDAMPKIRFYHGVESILKMFDDIFLTLRVNGKEEKTLLAISAIDDMDEAIGGLQKKVQAKRIKNKVDLRIISPRGPLAEDLYSESMNDVDARRQVKFFDPEKYPFRVAFNIYDDNISIFNLNKNPSGIIVEDKDLASSLRSLFNLVWDNLEKDKGE